MAALGFRSSRGLGTVTSVGPVRNPPVKGVLLRFTVLSWFIASPVINLCHAHQTADNPHNSPVIAGQLALGNYPTKFLKSETIRTGIGVKSVLVHPNGKTVYSMNLEGMSVYEFDRANRKTSGYSGSFPLGAPVSTTHTRSG